MILRIQENQPILVTGAHRSGTSWVGRMLASNGEAEYISEPLNAFHRRGVMQAKVKHWYTYVCNDNEALFLSAFQDTLNFKYHFREEVHSIRSIKDFLRMGRDWAGFSRGNLLRKRPLLKDPFAVFSIPWFLQRLGCQIVVIIRHPAAFVSSLKRLGWTFDFSNILQQPLLMRDYLEPYRNKMETIIVKGNDVIERGCLLWNLIYKLVSNFDERFSDLLLVRHEDLSIDPLDVFQSVYAKLGLEFNSFAKRAINKSTREGNPTEVSLQNAHSVSLDSRANIYNWKQRLSAGEITHIRDLTDDVAGLYYSAEDWK